MMEIKLKNNSIIDFDSLELGTVFEYQCDGDTNYGIKVEVYEKSDGLLDIELGIVFEYSDDYKITRIINASLVEE